MPSCLSCAPLVKDAHERVCTQCCLPDMQKPYDEATLRRWLAQMLLALDYLEQRGVLHVSVRDCAQCVCVCVYAREWACTCAPKMQAAWPFQAQACECSFS